MDGFITFLSIIFLVFGILQIILFFKIWGMCNNVKKLKEKDFVYNTQNYHFGEWRSKFYFFAFNGYKDEAKRMLLIRVWNSNIMNDMLLTNKLDKFDSLMIKLKYEFSEFFDALEEQFPSYENIRKKLEK